MAYGLHCGPNDATAPERTSPAHGQFCAARAILGCGKRATAASMAWKLAHAFDRKEARVGDPEGNTPPFKAYTEPQEA